VTSKTASDLFSVLIFLVNVKNEEGTLTTHSSTPDVLLTRVIEEVCFFQKRSSVLALEITDSETLSRFIENLFVKNYLLPTFAHHDLS
jgi:hypothetical protein